MISQSNYKKEKSKIIRDINKIKSSSCDIIFYNMTLWGGHRVFWKVRDKSI